MSVFRSFKQFREMAAFAHPGTDASEILNYHPLRNLLSKIPEDKQVEVMQWALEDATYEASKARDVFAKRATAYLHNLMRKQGMDPTQDETANTIYPEDLFTTDRLHQLAANQWHLKDPQQLMSGLERLYKDFDKYEPKYIVLDNGHVINLAKLNAQLEAEGKTPFKLGGPNGLLRYREDNPNFKDPVTRDPYGRNVRPTRGISLSDIKFGIDPDTRRGVYAGRDYDPGSNPDAYSRALTRAKRGLSQDIEHHQVHGKLPYGDDPDFAKILGSSQDKFPDDKTSLIAHIGKSDAKIVSHKAALLYAEKIRREIEAQLNGEVRMKDGKVIPRNTVAGSTKYVPASYIVKDATGAIVPAGSEGPKPYTVEYKGIAEDQGDTQNPFFFTGEKDANNRPLVMMRPQVRVAGRTFQTTGALGLATNAKSEEPMSAAQAIKGGYEKPYRVSKLNNLDYIEKAKYEQFPVDINALLDSGWLPLCQVCKGTGKAKSTAETNEAVKSSVCPNCGGRGTLTPEQIHLLKDLTLSKGANQIIHLVKDPNAGWHIKTFSGTEELTPAEKLAYKDAEAPIASVDKALKGGAKTLKSSARFANSKLADKFQQDWLNNPEKWGEPGPFTNEKGQPNPSHSLSQAAFKAMKRGETYGQNQDRNMSSSDLLAAAFNRASGLYNDSRFAYGDLNDKYAVNKLTTALGGLGLSHEQSKAWIDEFRNQQQDYTKPVMITSPHELINPDLQHDPRFPQILDLFRKNGMNWRKSKFSSIKADELSSTSIDKDMGDEGSSMSATIGSNANADRIAASGFQGMGGRLRGSKELGDYSLYGKLHEPGLLKHHITNLLNQGYFAKLNAQVNREPAYKQTYQQAKNLGINVLSSGDTQNMDKFQSLMPQDKNPVQQMALLDGMGDVYMAFLQKEMEEAGVHYISDINANDKNMVAIKQNMVKFKSILNQMGFDQNIKAQFDKRFDDKFEEMNIDASQTPAVQMRQYAQTGMSDMIKNQIVASIQRHDYNMVASLVKQQIKDGHAEVDLEKYKVFMEDPETFEDKLDNMVTQMNNIWRTAKARTRQRQMQGAKPATTMAAKIPPVPQATYTPPVAKPVVPTQPQPQPVPTQQESYAYPETVLLPQEMRQISTLWQKFEDILRSMSEAKKDAALAALVEPYMAIWQESSMALDDDLRAKLEEMKDTFSNGLTTFEQFKMRNKAKRYFEMMGSTGAIYDGSPTYDANRDWNWQGAPESMIHPKRKKKKHGKSK